MLRLISLLVLATLTAGASKPDCENHPSHACGRIDVLVSDDDAFSYNTPEMLDQRCGEAAKTITCIRDFLAVCPKESAFGNIVEIIAEICDKDTNLGQAYRAHVNCVNAMLNGSRPCEDLTEEVWKFITEWRHNNRIIMRYVNLNCIFDHLLKVCFPQRAGQHCGPQAESAIREMLSRQMHGKDCNPEEMIFFASQYLIYRD